ENANSCQCDRRECLVFAALPASTAPNAATLAIAGIEHGAQRALGRNFEIVRLVNQQRAALAVDGVVDRRRRDVVGLLRPRDQAAEDVEQYRLAAAANWTGEKQARRHHELVKRGGVRDQRRGSEIWGGLEREVVLEHGADEIEHGDVGPADPGTPDWLRRIDVARIRWRWRRLGCSVVG